MSIWHTLLELAVRAPSPHNVQPWRVRIVDDGTADIFLQKSRTLPAEDVTGSFLLLTMGLFLESLRVLAAHRELALDISPAHEPEWYRADHLATVASDLLPFARLQLRTDRGAHGEFDEATFLTRRTSRLPYAIDPLPEDAEAHLALIAERHGTRFTTVRDPARIKRLLRWNVDAVFEDLNQPGYHDEITSWFRLDDDEARRHRDGLDARCMNQSAGELWLVRHAPWLLRMPVLRDVFARRYLRQIGPVTTLGVLSGGFWEPERAYEDGRALIHFWVEVERLGWSIHPFGNLVTNRPIAQRVADAIGIPDPWLVFRIGRSRPAPQSYRRSVAEVLVD